MVFAQFEREYPNIIILWYCRPTGGEQSNGTIKVSQIRHLI